MKYFTLLFALFLTACSSSYNTSSIEDKTYAKKQLYLTCTNNDVIVFKHPYDRIGYDKMDNLYYVHSESKEYITINLTDYDSCWY